MNLAFSENHIHDDSSLLSIPENLSQNSTSSNSSQSSTPSSSQNSSPVKKLLTFNSKKVEDDIIENMLGSFTTRMINELCELKAVFGFLKTTVSKLNSVFKTPPTKLLKPTRNLFGAKTTSSIEISFKKEERRVNDFDEDDDDDYSIQDERMIQEIKLHLPGVKTIIPIQDSDPSLPTCRFDSGISETMFNTLLKNLKESENEEDNLIISTTYTREKKFFDKTNNRHCLLISTINDSNEREQIEEEEDSKFIKQECFVLTDDYQFDKIFYNPRIGECDFLIKAEKNTKVDYIKEQNKWITITDKDITSHCFSVFSINVIKVIERNVFNNHINPINPINLITYNVEIKLNDSTYLNEQAKLYQANEKNEFADLLHYLLDNMKLMCKQLHQIKDNVDINNPNKKRKAS